MTLQRMLLLNGGQANAIRGPSKPGSALEPRLIEAGPYAGKHALPEAVLHDDDHSVKRTKLLEAAPIVELDTIEAWPNSGL